MSGRSAFLPNVAPACLSLAAGFRLPVSDNRYTSPRDG